MPTPDFAIGEGRGLDSLSVFSLLGGDITERQFLLLSSKVQGRNTVRL